MPEGGTEATIPQETQRPPAADIFLTKAASDLSLPMAPTSFKPPDKPKKMMHNTKLQKNVEATTVLTASFYPKGDDAVPLCVDTGGEASCISREYLTAYFPSAHVRNCRIRLRGVGPTAVYAAGLVSLDIPMRALDGARFSFPVEVMLLDDLDCGLLLGTDTCLPNAFKIDFAEGHISTGAGYSFEARSRKKTGKALPRSLKKRGIYALDSVVIQPAQGAGIRIHHA